LSRCLDDSDLEFEDYESELMALLMAIGRSVVERRLASVSEQEAFTEGGVTWKPAVVSPKELITGFGKVTVDRPLFRAVRNGPTRCRVSEKVGVIRDLWTPRAAKLAAILSAELTLGRAEELLREMAGMTPSQASIHRLTLYLSELWEERREDHERAVREAREIPQAAVAVSVSLDGVMINTLESGAERATRKAQTRAKGQADRGPSGYKEASVGVVSLYDAEGKRLSTRRIGRMPELDKTTTKAWVEAELNFLRSRRPRLTAVAIADGSVGNWTFLERLKADHELVDYFHTTEHVYRHLSLANGASTLDTQAKFDEMKRALLEDKGGAAAVFKQLARMRKKAGTASRSRLSPEDGRRVDYFERHTNRMNYAEVRAKNLPIGSGVTEGTCRHVVVDRLRRSGMRWSQQGGQAVLTLRALVISGDFEPAWKCLRTANDARLRAA
jgi:hypothetical protein